MPFFEEIAKAYLDKKRKGIVNEKFDLYEVYRFTHGEPELFPSYMAQLHKSLFDVDELNYLLKESKFKSYKIFNYCFIGENHLPINLGFTAAKSEFKSEKLEKITRDCAKKYASTHINYESMNFLN